MRKLLILIYKDILILVKDKAGLAILFIMPVALVFIMTLLQDNTFRSINENGIKLAILNQGNDSIGNIISKNLSSLKMFSITNVSPGKDAERKLREDILYGKYQVGIIIPDSTTIKIKQIIYGKIAGSFSDQPGLQADFPDSTGITILVDPTTKTSFKTTIVSNIREFTRELENNVAFEEINRILEKILHLKRIDFNKIHVISLRQEYSVAKQGKMIPNSVQHNVPAWSLFAMFFIVISLASNMIREREEGSFGRLLNMPCNYTTYLMAKSITYLIVCMIQFVLMICVGIFLMPLVGLPPFDPGSNYPAIILIAISSALAAISYGLTIGIVSVSHQQAANFGSVSVVILAAFGGIFVPVFAMPPMMRVLSSFSPLNWGLEAFYDIFLRNSGIVEVLPDIAKLLVFAFAGMIVSIIYIRHKKK